MKKITFSLLASLIIILSPMLANDQCNALYQAHDYPQTEKCYKQQLKNERSFTNYFRIGSSILGQQRDKEALFYFLEAEKKASSLSNHKTIYSALGATYHYLGNKEKEYFYSMKYLDMALKSGDNESIATAYNNLANYFNDQKQPQKALEYYEKSLEYSEESKKAVVYNNLADLYDEQLNNPQKAEEMHFKAITLGEQTGDYNGLGQSKTNLGVFYYNHERYAEAKTTFNEALPIVRKAGLRESEATILEALELLKNK